MRCRARACHFVNGLSLTHVHHGSRHEAYSRGLPCIPHVVQVCDHFRNSLQELLVERDSQVTTMWSVGIFHQRIP